MRISLPRRSAVRARFPCGLPLPPVAVRTLLNSKKIVANTIHLVNLTTGIFSIYFVLIKVVCPIGRKAKSSPAINPISTKKAPVGAFLIGLFCGLFCPLCAPSAHKYESRKGCAAGSYCDSAVIAGLGGIKLTGGHVQGEYRLADHITAVLYNAAIHVSILLVFYVL